MSRSTATAVPSTHSVYVVLTRTDTRVARVIQILTRKPYSHASISMDVSLRELFSFCRNNPRFPLPATFNEEYVGKGVFGLYDNIPCEIYEIPLTEAQYRELCKQLLHFQHFRKRYSYSLLGLIRVPLQIQHELRYKFVCSQFVAYMLQECNVKLDKSASLYSPEDLRHLPTATLIYRGELNEYYSESAHDSPYELMRSVV